MSTLSARRAPRPLAGSALLVVSVVHLLVTPLVAGDSLDSILDAGVLASVDSDPELVTLRSNAFWYATAGIGLLALGVVVRGVERATGASPPGLGWLLIALALWGVALMPLSPFWAFLLVAVMAFRSSAAAARSAPDRRADRGAGGGGAR